MAAVVRSHAGPGKPPGKTLGREGAPLRHTQRTPVLPGSGYMRPQIAVGVGVGVQEHLRTWTMAINPERTGRIVIVRIVVAGDKGTIVK